VPKIQSQKVSRKKLLKRLSYKKFAGKMLMKLPPEVDFTNALRAAFVLADTKSAKRQW